ncbi:hypothetical protein ISCGN_026509, partial [Ixodes scapularis]
MSYVLVEFLLDKTQPVVSSDDVRDFSGVVEDDRVYQVYWAGDARTKGSFYDAKVLYMAACRISSRSWEPPYLSPYLAEHRNVYDAGKWDTSEASAALPGVAALVPEEQDEDQAEEPVKSDEEASEMDETSDKEMLGKRKGEQVLCTSDPGSTSQGERAESKRRRKRRTKSSSPEAPITEQDAILSGHDDLK